MTMNGGTLLRADGIIIVRANSGGLPRCCRIQPLLTGIRPGQCDVH
jgi:hypothetical protein